MVLFKARIICDFEVDEQGLESMEQCLACAHRDLGKVVLKLDNVDYLTVKRVGDIREV